MDCFEYVESQHLSQMKILMIDDDPSFLTTMSTLLKTAGINPFPAESGFQAIDLLRSHDFDAIIVDWKMPFMGGAQTLLHLDGLLLCQKRAERPAPPLVVCTSIPSENIILPPELHEARVVEIWQKHHGWQELFRVANRFVLDISKGMYQ